jgi:hypothetical protein
MERARFKRVRDVLVDQTADGRITSFHRAPTSVEATNQAIEQIQRRDYGRLSVFLSTAKIARVRPVLLAAAREATALEPNLSQALALVGGVEARRLLERHLKKAREVDVSKRTDEEHFRVLYSARALLQLRPSVRAASGLLEVVRFAPKRVVRVAAKTVSDCLLTDPPLPISRCLRGALPILLREDDETFAGALPILLQFHFGETEQRCKNIVSHGTDDARRRLVDKLLECSLLVLPLLLETFREEKQLEPRLALANALGAALQVEDLTSLANEALSNTSPSIRLRGAQLLPLLPMEVASRLAKRKDPETMVEAILLPFRSGV